MKTISFGIANYCVPCNSHCRHCLLKSCGKATGVDHEAGMAFADRVLTELKEQKPEVSGFYYIGYCMDTPKLADYLRFCRKIGSPGARFLQMNGFAFRSSAELEALMAGIKAEGVELVDLTFYGTKQYHDRFAGRNGDFDFNLKMLEAAEKINLPVNISMPLMRDNLDQMIELRQIPEIAKAGKYSYFLPHSKGRGKQLQDQRITKQEFENLPQEIRGAFQKVKHMTEAEWLASGAIPTPEKRSLTLVLTPDNFAHYADMSAARILKELEAMDNEFTAEMPTVAGLAVRYGRPDNLQLYRFRDLLLRWRQEYIAETGNVIYDMHDETHSFSVHI